MAVTAASDRSYGAPWRDRVRSIGPVAGGCLALAALSLLLHRTPSYDPWAWLVWGREIAGLDLDTTEGPAFKPLPVAVTTLLSPLGDGAAWVWLVLTRAATLLAGALAAVVGSRLAGGSLVAGAVAAAGVLLTDGWLRGGAVGNSESLLLALVLLGALRALDGHHRQALALAVAAALLRTEAWPFLAIYALWLWRREPAARALVAGAAVLLPLAWFLPDLIGAGDPLRSSDRARIPNPGAPALAPQPALESLGRALGLMPLAVPAGAALAALAVTRRELPRAALLPAGAAVAWLALVAGMSELGYSGEERYAMPGAALLAVSAGAGLAWAASRAAPLARRPWVVAAALVAVMAGAAAAGLAADVRSLRHQARFYGGLEQAVEAAGGPAAALRCGPVHTAPYSRPALAWRLEVPIGALSTETAGRGTVFRSRLTLTTPVGPPLAPPGGFRHAARVGEWHVLESCGVGR